MAVERVVIVGAGHAGFQLGASLRQGGFDGAIVLLSDERVLPYQRPPLSKDYLDGKIGLDLLLMRPEAFYRDHRIDYLPGAPAAEIDRAARQLRLASGERLGYDHLVLATGARNRVPPLPGIELDGVSYLRNLAETDELRERLADLGDRRLLRLSIDACGRRHDPARSGAERRRPRALRRRPPPREAAPLCRVAVVLERAGRASATNRRPHRRARPHGAARLGREWRVLSVLLSRRKAARRRVGESSGRPRACPPAVGGRPPSDAGAGRRRRLRSARRRLGPVGLAASG